MEGGRAASASSSSRAATPGRRPEAASPAPTACCSTRRAGSSSASTATAASPGSKTDGQFTTLADHYQGKRLNSPNDARLQVERRPLLHRPALRPARSRTTTRQKELDFNGVYRLVEGRRADPADQGDDLPQRHRLLARREDALRGQLRPEEGDLDGLRREGRRHAGQGPGLLRRHALGQGKRRRACPTA